MMHIACNCSQQQFAKVCCAASPGGLPPLRTPPPNKRLKRTPEVPFGGVRGGSGSPSGKEVQQTTANRYAPRRKLRQAFCSAAARCTLCAGRLAMVAQTFPC
eukprot:9566085-Alexandrium_andersonii.AAC.1